MGVVIVQSRATAHVYRMFGALVALLLLMALAVGLMRVRSDREAASPYGSLRSVAATTEIPSLPSPIVPPVPVSAPAQPASLPAPAAIVPAVAPTAVIQGQMAPVTTPPPAPTAVAAVRAAAAPVASPPPRPTPLAAGPAADPARTQPRQIALDQTASRSIVPQPAPPAMVAAATRAAAAPPVVRAAAPAPAHAPQPAVVASRETATDADAAATIKPRDGSTSGHVNINTASVDALNNVGAGHIGRTIAQHRPYRSLEDLVSRRILKARDFARIRSAIAID